MAIRKRSSSATTTQLPSQAALAAATREPPRYVDSVQFPAKYLHYQHNAPWQQLEGSELMQAVSEGLEHLLKSRPEFPVAELARFLKQRKQERDEGTANTLLTVANTRAVAAEAQKARDEKRKPVAIKQHRPLKPFSLTFKLAGHSNLPFVDPAATAASNTTTPAESYLGADLPMRRLQQHNSTRPAKKPRYVHSLTATFTPFPRTQCADPVLKSQMEYSMPASPTMNGGGTFGTTMDSVASPKTTNSPIQPAAQALPAIAVDLPAPVVQSPASPNVSTLPASAAATATPAPCFVTCGPIPLFGLLNPVEAALNELFARIQSDGYSHVRVIAVHDDDDVVYVDGHPHRTDVRRRVAQETGSLPSSELALGWAIEALLEANSDQSCHPVSETVHTSAMTHRVKVLSHLDLSSSPRNIIGIDVMDKVATSLFDKLPAGVDIARVAVVVISHVDREALSQLLATAYCVVTSQWKMAQVARLRRADSEALDSRDVEKEHHDAEAKIELLTEAHTALLNRQKERDERRRKMALQLKMQLNSGDLTSSPVASPSGSFVRSPGPPVDLHKALDNLRVTAEARNQRRARNEGLFHRMIDAERSRAVALIKNVVRKFLERKRAKRRKSMAAVSFNTQITAPTPSSDAALSVPAEPALKESTSITDSPQHQQQQFRSGNLLSNGTFSSARVFGNPAVNDLQNQEYERDMHYDIVKHIVAEGLAKYPDLLMTDTNLPPPLPRQVAVWSYSISRRKPVDDFDVSSEDEAWTPNYQQRTYLPPLTTRHTNINARLTVIQAMIDCDCDWRTFLFHARVLHAGVAAIQRRATRMLTVIAHWMMLLTYSALRSAKSTAVNGPSSASRSAPPQTLSFWSWMNNNHATLTTLLRHLPTVTPSLRSDLTTASQLEGCPLKEDGPIDLAHYLLVKLHDPLETPNLTHDARLAALWLDNAPGTSDDDVVNKMRVGFDEVAIKYAPPRPPRWSTYAAPHEQETPYLARQVHPRVPVILCPAGSSSKTLHLLAVTLGMNASALPAAAPTQPGGLLIAANSSVSSKAEASVYGSGILGMRHVPLHPQHYFAATHASGHGAKDMLQGSSDGSGAMAQRDASALAPAGSLTAQHHQVNWYLPCQHPLLYVTGRPYALVQRCATQGQFANAAIRVVQPDKKSNSGVLVPKPPRQGVVTAPQFRTGLEKSASLDTTASMMQTPSQSNVTRETSQSTDAAAEENLPVEHPQWPDTSASNPPPNADVIVSVEESDWLGQSLASIEARGQQDIENNLSQCDGVLGRYVFDEHYSDLRTIDVRTEAIRIVRSKRPQQKAEDGKTGDATADRRKARQSARALTLDNPPSPVVLTGASTHPQPHPPSVHAPMRSISRKDSGVSATNSAHAAEKAHQQRGSSAAMSPLPAAPPPLPASATDGPVVQSLSAMVQAVLPLGPLEQSHAINTQALLPCTHTLIRNPRVQGLNETIAAVSDLVHRMPPNPSTALGFRMVMLINDAASEFVLPAAATLVWFARCTVTNDGPARVCVDELNVLTSINLEQSLRDSKPPTVVEDDGRGRDINFSDDDRGSLEEDPTMLDAQSESAESTTKPLFATVTLSSAKRDDASMLRRAAAVAAAAKAKATVTRRNSSQSKPMTYIESSKVPPPLRPLACLSKLQELPELRSVDFQIDDAQLAVSAVLVRCGMHHTIRGPIERVLAVARGALPLPSTLPEQKALILAASRALESYAVLVFLQCYLTSAAWAEHADRTFENFIQYHTVFVNFLRFPKLLDGEIAVPVFAEGLFKDTDVSHANPRATPSTARGALPAKHHHGNSGSSSARGAGPTTPATSSPVSTLPWPLLHPRLLPLDFDKLMSFENRWETPTHSYALN